MVVLGKTYFTIKLRWVLWSVLDRVEDASQLDELFH